MNGLEGSSPRADQASFRSSDVQEGREFSQVERDRLLIDARDITEVEGHHGDAAWEEYAELMGYPDAKACKRYYETEVKPCLVEYDECITMAEKKRKKKKKKKQSRSSGSDENQSSAANRSPRQYRSSRLNRSSLVNRSSLMNAYSPENQLEAPSGPSQGSAQQYVKSPMKRILEYSSRQDKSSPDAVDETPSKRVRFENRDQSPRVQASSGPLQATEPRALERSPLASDGEREVDIATSPSVQVAPWSSFQAAERREAEQTTNYFATYKRHRRNSTESDDVEALGKSTQLSQSQSPPFGRESANHEAPSAEVINLVDEDDASPDPTDPELNSNGHQDDIKIYEFEEIAEDDKENEFSRRSPIRNGPEALRAFSDNPSDFVVPRDGGGGLTEISTAVAEDNSEDHSPPLQGSASEVASDEYGSDSSAGSSINVYSIPPSEASREMNNADEMRDTLLLQRSPSNQLRAEFEMRRQVGYNESQANPQMDHPQAEDRVSLDLDKDQDSRDQDKNSHTSQTSDCDPDVSDSDEPDSNMPSRRSPRDHKLPPNDSDSDEASSQKSTPDAGDEEETSEPEDKEGLSASGSSDEDDRDSLPYRQTDRFDTQWPLHPETPKPDLEVPLPPGGSLGLGDEDQELHVTSKTSQRRGPKFRSQTVDTQLMLNRDTMEPDLGMPLPPSPHKSNNVDRPSQPSGHDQQHSQSASAIFGPSLHHEPHRRALDTQGHLASDTQMPDLTVPVPPRRNASHNTSLHGLSSSPPSQPSSYKSRAESAKKQLNHEKNHSPIRIGAAPKDERGKACLDNDTIPGQLVESFVNYQTRAGYAENLVIFALERSTMDSRLAKVVLRSIGKGTGERSKSYFAERMPTRVPGVWTPSHDAIIQGGDARKIKKVATLHGAEMVEARLRWLLVEDEERQQ